MPSSDLFNDEAEFRVGKFYNSGGWSSNDEGFTSDAELYEDLRPCARTYISKCRLRIKKFIPENGKYMLDMASGPLQYPEYLEYSKNYLKRYCVDLSFDALETAKSKIGDHGEYLCGSFFDISLLDDYFDCCISLHTIYHMHKSKQEIAVRKLLNVAKPNTPVIIVYSNPFSLERFLYSPYSLAKRIISLVSSRIAMGRRSKHSSVHSNDLYFYCHSIDWWRRFSDQSQVDIYTWRLFSSSFQKMFVPDNKIGSFVFKLLFFLESKFSSLLARLSCYPLIVLTKK